MNSLTREYPGRRDLLALAAAQPLRYPCLLQSVVHGTPQARFDILFAFPQSVICLDAHGILWNNTNKVVDSGFLSTLDNAWLQNRQHRGDNELPFHGGWLLYLGYELAAEIEPRLRMPDVRDSAVPTALAVRCPAAIVVDHARDCTIAVTEADQSALLDALDADMQSALGVTSSSLSILGVEEDEPERYLDGVERIHAYLRAGDVFQVNLSREWRVKLSAPIPPASLYAHLRAANPAPFAGLLQWDNWAVLSSSPERLVEVRGDQVQTRPIAGTRPRQMDDDATARIRDLTSHPKERAEHVMLIDLARNDLGRVCVPGTIVVDELMSVESYTHVHHIVSNVRGQLRAQVTPGEVIRSVFPGGTITGCPKVRCMEIIAELEGVGRGPYTGSLGYLNRDGSLDLNILIRTLQQHGDNVSLRAGAGIVVDSLAERELQETRAKARGLLRAFGISG